MKNAGHLLQDAKPLWKCPPLFESNTPTQGAEGATLVALASTEPCTLGFKRRVEEGPGGAWQAFSAGLPPG